METLRPNRRLLEQEFLLVQAWKKATAYIRSHNWFADTLALDRAAVNLPAFLSALERRIATGAAWQTDPLRIVPAPKRQAWRVHSTGSWGPVDATGEAVPLRPIAHVSLPDQVLATAVMLVLADRVETAQGDPRPRAPNLRNGPVISYGNRLFCDNVRGRLRHRWGSSKLYRAYSQDYREFLARSENTASVESVGAGRTALLLQADLKQFYDRVRPEMLAASLERLKRPGENDVFFDFATSVFDWRWDQRDQQAVERYSQETGIRDFERIALPQGLVASGFMANLVLLPFDDAIRRAIGTEIAPGLAVCDACRYVDDLRIVLGLSSGRVSASDEVEHITLRWLTTLLSEHAEGLELSADKTKLVVLSGDDAPVVRQSVRMNRIQSAVSGGFDAIAGEEILDAIQGLMNAQEALTPSNSSGWRLAPVPDVRDDTVARFGAARFRRTFRSIRPLLDSRGAEDDALSRQQARRAHERGVRVGRSQQELDGDARAFALGLIDRWVHDPSNVRLLRIGLDLWPDAEVLSEVLGLLAPYTVARRPSTPSHRVAWYCLAEILRAGATETGFVEDAECLPSGVDLGAYRERLCREAVRVTALPTGATPWYLRQQALLFLAAFEPFRAGPLHAKPPSEARHYRTLIRFLRGEQQGLRNDEFVTLAVLARRAFGDQRQAIELVSVGLTPARIRALEERDPSFADELLEALNREMVDDVAGETPTAANRGAVRRPAETLAERVRRDHPVGALRNELGLLRFAQAFLRQLGDGKHESRTIVPDRVELRLAESNGVAEVLGLRIRTARKGAHPMYDPPRWARVSQHWRFQLGFLLRFVLAGRLDFTRPVRAERPASDEAAYRVPESHWYQRRYGMFSGQPAFGDDWLPITDWVEQFLLALLRWPGCRIPPGFKCVEMGFGATLKKIGERIEELESYRGRATGQLVLRMRVGRPTADATQRPLVACVVQTATPGAEDFTEADLTLKDPKIRKKHRNHLSAALAAVERMLALRNTHREREGRLDWLILPELAVHPLDIRTHLVPFARAHRALVLAGLTYERLLPGKPLVNSAVWIIPEWTPAHGLQVRTRRQGKEHLAPNERIFNRTATQLQGFRPCQWLIGYPWSPKRQAEPAWLTASVCYDATDLAIAADLKGVADVFAIPALNKDVHTFDQMALALHYHMFQLVVVANNGQYGGSNAYWPTRESYTRQVFHLHGQPQASIAFFEIEDIPGFLSRRVEARGDTSQWKHPPAGIDGM